MDEERRVECVDILGHVDIKNEKVLDVSKKNINTGPDGICPRVLREARAETAWVLTETFASSLSTGEVPEDWRMANVVPLFKKDNKDNPGNFRRVILTSVGGKLLDRILRDRTFSHLETN